MQGVGAEIVGGIIGGLVVAISTFLFTWGHPRFKKWKINHAYSLRFVESYKSKKGSKSKTIGLGKQVFYCSIKMKSQRYITNICFNFKKGETGGLPPATIVSFENVGANNKNHLPYRHSLDPSQRNSSSQRATISFHEVNHIKKGESLIYEFTVDAKMPWSGDLVMEPHDENGSRTTRSLKFNIIDSRQLNLDREDS